MFFPLSQGVYVLNYCTNVILYTIEAVHAAAFVLLQRGGLALVGPTPFVI